MLVPKPVWGGPSGQESEAVTNDKLNQMVAFSEQVGGNGNGSGVDATAVHLTGAETVAGIKTFSTSPAVPTLATGDTSTKAANAAFVAAAIAGKAPKTVFRHPDDALPDVQTLALGTLIFIHPDLPRI